MVFFLKVLTYKDIMWAKIWGKAQFREAELFGSKIILKWLILRWESKLVVHSALVISNFWLAWFKLFLKTVSFIYFQSDWLFTDPALVSATTVHFFLYPIHKISNVENITYMAYLMTTIQWNRWRYSVFTVG